MATVDGREAGIIVYTFAPHSCRGRRDILSEALWRGPLGKRLAKVNRSMRLIQRVVVRPELRGAGIASALVRRTLPLVNTDYVECLAVEGGFLKRAGMKDHGPLPLGRVAERFVEALASEKVDAYALAEASAFEEVPERALMDNAALRGPFLAAFREFIETRHSALRGLVNALGMEPRTRRVFGAFLRRMAERPRYYLWTRDAV